MRQLVLMIAIGATMAFAASTMVGCEADSANGAVSGSADEVVGSWIVDITPEGGDPFKALLTFTQDGGVLESEAQASQSTAHGRWSKVGDHRFALMFVSLLSTDFEGTFGGSFTIRSTIQINGNDFTDPGFTLEVVDPDGNQISSGTGTARGKRIVLGS